MIRKIWTKNQHRTDLAKQSIDIGQRMAAAYRQAVIALAHTHTQPDQIYAQLARMQHDLSAMHAESLYSAQIISWLDAFGSGYRRLPQWFRNQIAETQFSGFDKPPDKPLLEVFFPGDKPGPRFSIIEAAVKALQSRNVLTRDQFDLLSHQAKASAFTIGDGLTTQAIEDVRQILNKAVADGPSLSEFRTRVAAAVPENVMSPGKVELVYRQAINASYRDGRESLMRDPVISEVFPYQQYLPIHDGRVRHEHLALGSMGIDDTDVYRRDDPFWDYFSPPWDYNSVATGEMVTTARGQVPIERIVPGDTVLTHLGNWRPVLGCHTAKGPSELVSIQTSVGSMRLTAEHRVFTQNGWIAASDLHVGHKLYQVANAPDLDLVVRKVNESLESERFDNRNVPIETWPNLAALQFDPQVQRRDVNIEPIGRRRFVKHAFNTSVAKCQEYRSLVRAWIGNTVDVSRWIDEMCCFTGGDHARANFGTTGCAVQLVGGRNRRLSLGISSIVDSVSLSCATGSYFERYQHPTQRTKLDSSFCRDIAQVDVAANIGINGGLESTRPSLVDLILRAVAIRTGTTGLIASHKTPLKTVKVTKVQQQLYRGLVHDISVQGDESFFVNGHAVSNCRCGANMLTIEQAARLGVKEAKQWLATGQKPPLKSRLTFIQFRPRAGFGQRSGLLAV